MKDDDQSNPSCDLLLPFMMGEIEGEELYAFFHHVDTCIDCKQELDAIWPIHSQMLTMGEDHLPNVLLGDLKHKTLEKAFSLRAPHDVEKRVTYQKPRYKKRRVLPYALSAAMLLLGIWIGTSLQTSSIGSNQPQSVGSPSRLVLNTALVATSFAPSAYGEMTIITSGKTEVLMIKVSHLQPIVGHGCYTVWLLKDGSKTLGGRFMVNQAGVGAVTIRVPFGKAYTGIGITKEPHVSDQSPKGPKVLGASVQSV